jgi:dTDP-4-amino-4,6-dideoxygalactose transaminase
MQKSKIPFNKPFIVGKELNNIAQAVQYGNLAGDGPFTEKCSKWMEEQFKAKKVLLVHSCTAALEIAAILCDIKPGDEVIVPSFTFVSTANAFVLRGAKPIFVDIRSDTKNMDENMIEELITEKTKVIIPVHYAGVSCEMDKILALADKYNLLIVEDAAQGVCSTYKGKHLGTIGHLGCYSFHETKNFISGEGGALVINDDTFLERAEIIREKGTNRSKFFRGQVDKYTWIDIGSSYITSELTAAFLYAQLEEAEKITQKRHKIWNKYYELLKPIEDAGLISIPYVPNECYHNAHMFYIILSSSEIRTNLINYLSSLGINTVFHYVPLHSSVMGKKFHKDNKVLPVTDRVSECILRLPCFYELTMKEILKITNALTSFIQKKQNPKNKPSQI